MTKFAEAPVKEYELCDACEKAMEEAGVFGLTTEEMYKQQSEFMFDLAFILMGEGFILARKAKPDQPISIVEASNSCEETPHYEIARIEPDTEQVLSYIQLLNEDILASDWYIVKITEEKQEEKFKC